MNKNTSQIAGGISNTPLTNTSIANSDTFIEISTKEMRSVFDWCSITFEDFDISKFNNKFILSLESKNKLNRFLSIIGFKKGLDKYKVIPGKNGFSTGYQLDENIYLFYGADNIKSSENRYLCQLLMSGQGCREFETYHNGNWKTLFTEIKKMRYYNLPRIDLATDDFTGVYNIYDIEKKLRSGEATTPFKNKIYLINEFGKRTKGYTIELGTRGKNQLVIYDKNLERKAKELEDESTTFWYRYEIRLTDDKAKELVDEYLLSCDNPDFKFGKFTAEILYSLLDIKINDGTSNKSRWPTDPNWLKLLGCVEKNKLSLDEKIPSTIEKKRKWYENMETTNAELFITSENFMDFIIENIINGLKNLKDVNMHRIRNFFTNQGVAFTDDRVNEIIEKLETKKMTIIDEETGEIMSDLND